MINVKIENGSIMFSEIFTVKSGNSQHRWNDKLGNYIKTLKDGQYECSVRELEITKTNDQLALIHVYIKIFSDDGGFTPMQAKLACKEITGYFTAVKNVIRGGTSIDYKSFRDAGIKELSRIIDEFYTYLTVDCGLNVPSSEEWKKMTNEEKNKLRYR